MKIFVTGATGFIGSHFVEQAIQAGHTVVGLRRSETSQPRIKLTQEPIWLTKSMADLRPIDFDGCECLVHLAAHTANVPYDTLENCLYWNMTVPIAMIRAAHQALVSRFVIAGSCFEYGKSGERYEFIPTDAPLEPTATYPASKAIASIAFAYLAMELRLHLSIHRIFQVYGEGEFETRFWPSLKRAALEGNNFQMTSGEQIRDFVAVEFVASKLIAALPMTDIVQGVCSVQNIGSGRSQSLKAFAEHWWRHWNAKGELLFDSMPMRVGEMMRYVPDCFPRIND